MTQANFSNRLKDIREEHDLKQKDLAQILGVSRPNYTRWETQEKIIPLTKLNTFCNYFHINMDYCLGLTNQAITMNQNYDLNAKIIGQNLKNFRLSNHITQVQLAKILGTTHSVISAYENGKTLILTAFLINLCTYYHISANKLCNRF